VTGVGAQLVIIAKEPAPGRVKTRLTPPFTPVQAAALAAAALSDTLDTAAQVPFPRRVLALAGEPGGPRRWQLPPGFEITGQRGDGLDERIAAALAGAYARLPVPVMLIGMDTPQVTTGLLESAARWLASGGTDAVLGPASDGGFWLLGLRRPDPGLVAGVPMSCASTGRVQLARLRGRGLRTRLLPVLCDVDTVGDAVRVARQAPGSRFAEVLRDLGVSTVPPGPANRWSATTPA
jgi:hypothetical protein